MPDAYVLAVVGESPAVLTELIWWLVRVEGCSLAGIEVWATGRGARRLRALAASPAWEALARAVGGLPSLWSADAPPSRDYGYRIHTWACGGEPLDDVRTDSQAEAVAQTLHDRVLALREQIPEQHVLIGSLAGGRKTVSAALQTAFSLHARRQDRLVHVVLHEDLEAHLRSTGQLRSFHFPDETWAACCGVPVEDQLVVYDARFPRLRLLVEPARLDRQWSEVWDGLEEDIVQPRRAVLVRTGSPPGRTRWRYAIVDLDEREVVPPWTLTERLGSVLAAIASAEVGMGVSDILEILEARRFGWPTEVKTDYDARRDTLRSAARDLREKLAVCPPGLQRFVPARGRYHLDVDVEIRLEASQAGE